MIWRHIFFMYCTVIRRVNRFEDTHGIADREAPQLLSMWISSVTYPSSAPIFWLISSTEMFKRSHNALAGTFNFCF